MINHYHDDAGYIDAVANSIQQAWRQRPPGERLLFSFHGIPKRFFTQGDPYHCECLKTARLVAEKLQLPPERWQVGFQSRFGREAWLQPYADHTLRQWASDGVASVDVVCPGFSADCLETLEEVAMVNRDIFLGAGGQEYRYIPALNDSDAHMLALCDLVQRHMQGWPEADPDWSATQAMLENEASRERALSLGAVR
jgi:ferrochelatase